MDFFVKSGHPEKQRVGCVVVGIFERRKLSAPARALDTASHGAIASIMRRGDMDGKPGQTLLLHKLPNMFCDRVLLVGCGRERDFDDAAFRKACVTAARGVRDIGARDVTSYLTELNVRGRSHHWKVKQALLAVHSEFYRFDQCKSEPEEAAGKLERFIINVPRRSDLVEGEAAIREAQAIANGLDLTKNLANLPANQCTPSYLAEQAEALGKRFPKLKTRILDEEEMEKLGMGALLSVSRGSREPARLIIMEHRGAGNNQKPHVLVGKGITFDAGGISLKPAAKMDEMKYDMCGAASVFGAVHMAAELELPINLVGVVASSENLPGGRASKPGDIVTTLSGQTVEILNTDAEGRLVLCDALSYVERNYDPAAVIDIATLTGACVVALGHVASGLFSNQPQLAREIRNAAEDSGDRVWELPLWEDYQDQLKSNFADFANIGTQGAGAITAASFLHRFTRKLRWAHLDVAGTAWNSGDRKGATGRPLPLLCQYLLDRVANP